MYRGGLGAAAWDGRPVCRMSLCAPHPPVALLRAGVGPAGPLRTWGAPVPWGSLRGPWGRAWEGGGPATRVCPVTCSACGGLLDGGTACCGPRPLRELHQRLCVLIKDVRCCYTRPCQSPLTRGTGGFRFRFRTTCPRLQHSRRGTQKTRGSQPPQGGLLGPAWKGRSGRPVAAPRATGGRHLPSFGGGGSACGVGGGARAVGGSRAQGRQCAAGVGLDGVGEGAAGKAQRGPRSAAASRLAPTGAQTGAAQGRRLGLRRGADWGCAGAQTGAAQGRRLGLRRGADWGCA